MMPPRDEFDEEGYLLLNPDVAKAIETGIVDSGWQHFTLHGFAENRRWLARPNRMQGVCSEISPADEMFLGNGDHYFDVGESALHCIESALQAAGRQRNSLKRILDLPCGHGRVLRFLRKAFPHARFTACDLNQDGVAFCAKTFAAEPVVSRKEIDQIPLTPGFDLIWCGSLLTHLPVDRCAAFLGLFRRLLVPTGVLVFTLHGSSYEQRLLNGRDRSLLSPRQITSLLDQYRKQGFGYVDYDGQSGYGFSMTHPSFARSQLIAQPGWRLVGYHERGWDKRQDVVTLQPICIVP